MRDYFMINIRVSYVLTTVHTLRQRYMYGRGLLCRYCLLSFVDCCEEFAL